MKRFLAVLALTTVLSGCATAKFSHVGGRTIADINNTGWYLFNVIPLAAGNPTRPNAASCRLFTATCTLENNLKMLDFAMRDYISDPAELVSARYGEVVSYTSDESVLFFLFKRHRCHTSAELILKSEQK